MGTWLKRILLIAAREYKHHAKSKGFWITMIAVPVIAALGGVIPQWFQDNKPVRDFVVIDRQGGVVEVIDAALERDAQRRALRALRDYAEAHADPARLRDRAPLLAPQIGDVSEADLTTFVAWGGTAKALESLKPILREGAPAFEPPPPRFRRVEPPPGVDPAAAPAAIGEALGPWLRGERTLPGGGALFAAIVVPEDYAPQGGPARIGYWSANITDPDLTALVERALTAAAQRDAYAALGIEMDRVSAIESRRIALEAFNAGREGGAGPVSVQDRLLTVVPLALALMLWMSIFTVGNLLLSGIIEERSNKLIEVLLSSVTAEEFMAGKLLGIAGIGLTILTVWLGAVVIVALNGSGPVAEFGRMAIAQILDGPYIPAFAFYFVTGYLMVASVFLGLGSLANSQQEAQSLMTPLIFVLLLPFFLIVPLMQDPNGPLSQALAWIPLYTPFVMMFRISTNPPWTEVVATGALVTVFTIVVVWLMARLFRNAILRTGQPPRLVEFFRLMFRREAA